MFKHLPRLFLAIGVAAPASAALAKPYNHFHHNRPPYAVPLPVNGAATAPPNRVAPSTAIAPREPAILLTAPRGARTGGVND